MKRKRKCKGCGTYSRDYIITPVAAFCDYNCATSYAYKNKEKGREKIFRQKKRSYKKSDLKIRHDAAVRACHLYIRTRDKNNGCITCGRSLSNKFDAGHFIKAGSYSYTKFMEKNIHGQCVNCNQYNGGREREYKDVLVKKYGQRTVDALLRAKNRKIKRTAEDYAKIEQKYKEKLKNLK